jgi:hypothetical protein
MAMSEHVNPRLQKSRRGVWLIVIPITLACCTLASCALSVSLVGVGQEQDLLTMDVAPLIGLPTGVVGIVVTAFFLAIAEVGLWRRPTQRSHRILLSLVVSILGVLGIPIAAGSIALVSSLTRGLYELPWSVLIGAPMVMLVICAASLTVGVLVGPVLLIISLTQKAPTVSVPPAGNAV